MRLSRPVVAFVLLLCSLTVRAEDASGSFRSGRWGIEASYLAGKIFKHSPKVNHVPRELSQGFQIDVYKKTLGEQPWHKPLNFPEFGGTLLFIRFGENKVFGDVIALMGYGKFYMYRSKYIDLYTRVGAGYGYITKKYDYLTNPTNNLISSNINLSVQIKIGAEWKMSPWTMLSSTFSFNHFSNSATNLPNYGANLLMGSIGIKAIPMVKDLRYNCERRRDFLHNEITAMYVLGIQETYGFNGPKFPIHTAVLTYARYTSPGNKVFGGFCYEYVRAVQDFLNYNEITTRYSHRMEATTASVILGDEIMLGRVGMYYSAGFYLWKDYATFGPMYFRLGANVYFAQFGKKHAFKLFGGNYVKAHTSVAQSNQFSLGGSVGFK
ncbi:MAG: acyloxyacyl hydrolase [Bacteroidetes bacterium]|nr:acyloxyacyl hydrolase [Bacteroidota bacterium]